jgi:hypothetical protein
MTWQNLPTVKKGNVGEGLVNEYLIGHGYIPYSPDAGGAHPFDRLVASRDKKTIFIADAKTKAARKYYPDTGINERHYEEYKYIQDKYGIDVFIFFVDEEAQKIYGNVLRKLEAEAKILHKGSLLNYPMKYKGIIYFPLEHTKHIADIPQEQAEVIKQYTTKQEAYK